MPAGKRGQSNAMLYTLITFVGFFIIATASAVIYYVKFEEQSEIAETSKSNLKELVTKTEWQKRGTIVGTIKGKETYLGKMVDYLDQVVYLITGPPEDTSAEVKVDTASRKTEDVKEKVKEALGQLPQEYLGVETVDPNTTGLIRIIKKLKTKLDNVTNAELALKEQLEELQNRFDDAMTASFEKEQELLAEKEEYQQQVRNIERRYNELEALLEKTTERQVQILRAQLEEQKANYEREHQEKLKTQAKLKMAQDRMERALQELAKIKPPPETEVKAYEPDGKIMLIDNQARIVHLNIGSNDRVYRGLTFSVYDKTMPIPRHGRGKAEIEVFNVEKNISAARIIRSDKKRPIIPGDIIANLIWDSDKTNVFVVAGEFDLDGDGDIDYGAVDKIKSLIEKWGGRVADTVYIDTDFLVLGRTPKVLKKPTFEDMEVYPMAMEKYEASLQKLTHYKEVKSRAIELMVPILNGERFLYFIGYKTQAGRAGAF